MTRGERDTLIARYAGGYDEVVRSLAGFPAEALTARLLPGKWSAAEIVHHLGDAEPISAQRLRTLLVQERPLILAYDQEAYARLLRYTERPIEPALEAFRAARANTVGLLRGSEERGLVFGATPMRFYRVPNRETSGATNGRGFMAS